MVVFDQHFLFGSKADTLVRLKSKLSRSAVPDFFSFTVGEWRADPQRLLAAADFMLKGGRVIVRSSALSEDGQTKAQAGAFASVPGIDPRDRKQLGDAIETVIASYGRHDAVEGENPENQILVQAMVEAVQMSGVIFTQDLNSGAPYYVINYDDESGSTDSVTSGDRYSNRTLYIHRDAWQRVSSPRFLKLIEAVREIEAIAGDAFLDIEFALDAGGNVKIFQARRITTKPNWNRGLTLRVRDMLRRVRELLSDRYGTEEESEALPQTVLGVMPDWNPAEMIGTAPRPLALSLYQVMVTDEAWRIARQRMGYKHRSGAPLMLSLGGRPYIDVRESFHSFLPADLPGVLGDQLVDLWLNHLRQHHELHDKVEFEVAITAFAPDFDRRADRQMGQKLGAEDRRIFRDALRTLTNALITGKVAPIAAQRAMIEELSGRRRTMVAACRRPDLMVVRALLEDAVDHGVVPFATLARHAFIASSFLRALELLDVISSDELLAFQRAIPTVATEFSQDARKLAAGQMAEADFLSRYGHLRPGTYDILSPRYDARPEFWSALSQAGDTESHAADISPRARVKLGGLLKECGLEVNVETLLTYIREAIQGREYAKFVFTHNVSDALEILAAWGERHGLSRDELSMIPIRDILDAGTASQGRSIEDHLRSLADRGARDYEVTTAIRLPFLITRYSDLVIAPLAVNAPNFITRRSIRAPVLHLRSGETDPAALDGKIVAIESADPGYDWIFTRPLAGLITQYGGANSHMAIRCAEFGLPAAIGCGEQIFDRVTCAAAVELKCAEGRILIAE